MWNGVLTFDKRKLGIPMGKNHTTPGGDASGNVNYVDLLLVSWKGPALQ